MVTLDEVKDLAMDIIIQIRCNEDLSKTCVMVAKNIEKLATMRTDILKIPFIKEDNNGTL